MKKTTAKLSDIKPNPDNPRIIKDDKFKKLVQSIKDFPEMLDAREIVVNQDMMILGGNMRYKAAKAAGIKELPVKIVDWAEEKQREFIIKDNVSGGEWDWDMLANEWDIEELDDWGLDTPDTWGDDKEVEEDEAPEVDESEPPKSKLGEVYQLGRHRLMCGDSVSNVDVGMLLGELRADLVFTDPPWNVNYGAVKAGNAQGYKANRTIENDNMGEDFTPWMNAVFGTMSEFSKDGCMTYVVMSAQEWGGLMSTLKENGYHWSSTIIWNKDHLVLSRKDYHTKYEPIWYGWKEGESRLHPLKDRKQSDVWDIDRPTRSDEHPTMKPIELCARAINNSSKKDDIILDLFLGSGSTLIACEQTGRICYGSELDPRYVDVIRKRYWKFVNNNDETGWEENTPEVKENK